MVQTFCLVVLMSGISACTPHVATQFFVRFSQSGRYRRDLVNVQGATQTFETQRAYFWRLTIYITTTSCQSAAIVLSLLGQLQQLPLEL